MHILVTGGTGLVGSAIEGERISFVSSSDYSLIVPEQARHCLFSYRPDIVIHCAAHVGGVGANIKNQAHFFDLNIAINTNVISMSHYMGVKKVVAFLSTCIFPDNAGLLTEDKIHDGPPHGSNFGYAYAKRMLEVQCRAYRDELGLNYVCLIPCNIYGPNDNFDLENGHVIPSLIHKCYLAKRDKKPFVIWGSGKPLRELVYSKDVAEIALRFARSDINEGSFIVSPSVEYSIKDVAMAIVKAFEFEGEVVFDSSKPEGQYRKPSSNAKLMSVMPDLKFTGLEEGLQKTVDWFISNYPNVRGVK